MEFTFETKYDQKALTAMAGALRKTLRKKRSRRAHVFGWIVVILGLLLTFVPGEEGFTISFRLVLTWLAVLLILVVFLFEDKINGYVAKKRMLPGMEKSTTVFTAKEYHSKTDVGTSEFSYDKIAAVAETSDYFVLVFSENHAQIYDKNGMTGGTAEEFRKFIGEVSHKEVQKI